MKYRMQVGETRIVFVFYVVEASSEEEAIRKAEEGDTIAEDWNADGDVTHREVVEDPEEITEEEWLEVYS